MTNSCISNQYYSGQGSVLVATKNVTTGEPEGFIPVGNVSALTLSIETTVFEHKESCTGTRGIDKEIVASDPSQTCHDPYLLVRHMPPLLVPIQSLGSWKREGLKSEFLNA